LSVLAKDSQKGVHVKVVEEATVVAEHVILTSELLSSPIYAAFAQGGMHALVDVAGPPPFTLQLGKKRGDAQTFSSCARGARHLAKEAGIQLSASRDSVR